MIKIDRFRDIDTTRKYKYVGRFDGIGYYYNIKKSLPPYQNEYVIIKENWLIFLRAFDNVKPKKLVVEVVIERDI